MNNVVLNLGGMRYSKVYTILQTYVILFIFPLLLMPSGPFYFKSAAEHEDGVFLR